MEVMEEFVRTAPLRVIRLPFEMADEEVAGWNLPSEFGVATTDEIEGDLALGHPGWGSLLRVAE